MPIYSGSLDKVRGSRVWPVGGEQRNLAGFARRRADRAEMAAVSSVACTGNS
jgi:hypothetical protein